jgi:hypothetical protein
MRHLRATNRALTPALSHREREQEGSPMAGVDARGESLTPALSHREREQERLRMASV